jgi:thioredoxin reductase (NADPH)
MDVIVAVGLVAVALILLFGVRSFRRELAHEDKSRAALARTEANRIQPVSLHPVIDPNICIGTGACVEACPEPDVLGLVDGAGRLVNPTSCIGHGECLRACPVDAIKLVIGTEQRGVDIPLLGEDFATNVPGLFIVGELGGMGLIYNAMTQALQCMQGLVRSVPKAAPGVHQLVIVGAGPAGLAASLAAKAAKLDFVTVDQESMGGTVLQYPRKKIVMSRPVELPLYGKLHVTTIQKEALLDAWKQIVAKTGLEIRGQVRVDAVRRGADGIFDLKTSQGDLRAHRVLLALGRRGTPRKLGVPGEELPKVTYRLLEPEEFKGARCLVVGGGDSAVEAALALAEAGATAHLSYRSESFSRIKPKNQARLDAAVAAGTVTLMLSSAVKAIHPDAVELTQGDAAHRLPNDYVFVFAGGVLPTEFLAAAGVQVQTFKGEAFAPANR